ncbi:MAG TPA: DUF47 family protein [Thermoanaerobaculaceae bacterium]|nr:DUF47 family protein [Thermoanaerobaculaceae bacterium]
MRWFLPKNTDFLELFDHAMTNIIAGVALFRELINDLDNLKPAVERLKELEHEGDRITHQTLGTLNTTFITPFDREDIYTLAISMDDILDMTDAAAQRLVIFNVKSLPSHFFRLADLLVQSADAVRQAVVALHDHKQLQQALTLCVEINRIENEADQVHREALAELFNGSHDAIEIIKLKELFQLVEGATDRCEDVANVVEAIVIKNG